MTFELAVQIGLIISVASVVATVAGFGNSLVAMPLLISFVGVRTAAPLMALAGLLTWAIRFVVLRRQVRYGLIRQVIAASLVTIPVGVAFVSYGPEVWLRTTLGVMTVAYVVYRWAGRKVPSVEAPAWGLGVGAVGGVLSGAFNTAGPVIVMYGDARRWAPDEFRANLALYFFTNLIMVNATHAVAGNISEVVWAGFLVSVPFVIGGLWIGTRLVRRVNRDRFSQIVLILLLALGLRLALSWLF